MLSAVKMEGHEHPEWSGGSYYGEAEVRAPNSGIDQSFSPLIRNLENQRNNTSELLT